MDNRKIGVPVNEPTALNARQASDRELLEMTIEWLASFSRGLAYVQEALAERLHEAGEPPAPGGRPDLRLVPPLDADHG